MPQLGAGRSRIVEFMVERCRHAFRFGEAVWNVGIADEQIAVEPE